MKNIFLIALLSFPICIVAQGSNNKFLQLRDFSTGGINANETYFVDKQNYQMEGSPYVFESYIPSKLLTKDSATYYSKISNINLQTNNYEIINNGQYFTYNRKLIQQVEFQFGFDSVVVINYFDVLDEFGVLLFKNDLTLVRVFELSVKEADYRADLNVGSKSATYRVKSDYFLITKDGNSLPFNSKRDVKHYISYLKGDFNKKTLLKGLSFRSEDDLIEVVTVLDKL